MAARQTPSKVSREGAKRVSLSATELAVGPTTRNPPCAGASRCAARAAPPAQARPVHDAQMPRRDPSPLAASPPAPLRAHGWLGPPPRAPERDASASRTKQQASRPRGNRHSLFAQLLFDSRINSWHTIHTNIYHICLMSAIRFACYVRALGATVANVRQSSPYRPAAPPMTALLRSCARACVCACVRMRVHVCLCGCACEHVRGYLSVCALTCTCLCVYVCVRVRQWCARSAHPTVPLLRLAHSAAPFGALPPQMRPEFLARVVDGSIRSM
jgi:hypothetical protein